MLTCKVIGVFFFPFSFLLIPFSLPLVIQFFSILFAVLSCNWVFVIVGNSFGSIHDFGNGVGREKDVGEGCSQLHFSSVYNEGVYLVKFRRSAIALHYV
jgi:hypothetical protein